MNALAINFLLSTEFPITSQFLAYLLKPMNLVFNCTGTVIRYYCWQSKWTPLHALPESEEITMYQRRSKFTECVNWTITMVQKLLIWL